MVRWAPAISRLFPLAFDEEKKKGEASPASPFLIRDQNSIFREY